MQGKKKVIGVLEDLLFVAKISDAARRLGLEFEFVKTERDAIEKAKLHPLLIIVDLNCIAAQPLKLISKLKGTAETKNVDVIGYVSHVQGDLKQKAHEIGCDMVLARSAFSQNLQQILKRHIGIPA